MKHLAASARPLALVGGLLSGCGGGGTTADAGHDLATADLAPLAQPGFRGRTVYELFVRSFADSDGDGVGDLKGLTAKLDYLNDGQPGSPRSLGVNAVWLMPVQPSPSYHGYDVSDYEGVNPAYGTQADLDAFLAAAHQRGIQVLLDFVLNHSSSVHPWFLSSQMGASAARRDWYVWKDQDPHWSRPWDQSDPFFPDNGSLYYGLFCGCMPDLNWRNPAVEQELTTVMKGWVARGVDGFRLDAVRYYVESADGKLQDQPETHAILKRLRSAMPDTVMVGEAWAALETQATYYGSGDELPLAFSFDLAGAIVSSVQKGDVTDVVNVLARSEAAFADRNFEAPFLTNHDQVRVMRALGFDAGKARAAAVTLFAMPGTPFIYYGEELGMMGGGGGDDRNKRTPMRWDATAPNHGFTSGAPWYSAAEFDGIDVATEQADSSSLWNLYRQLIALRRAQVTLQTGGASRPHLDGAPPSVLALLRTPAGSGDPVLLIANYGAAPSGPFRVTVPGATADVLLGEGLAGAPQLAAGALAVGNIAPNGFAYVHLAGAGSG